MLIFVINISVSKLIVGIVYKAIANFMCYAPTVLFKNHAETNIKLAQGNIIVSPKM